MKAVLIVALLAGLGALAACTTPQAPATRIVKVQHTRYVPVPSTLTKPCPVYSGKIRTNDDLVKAYISDRASLKVCNEQLRQIRALKAPASGT